MMFSMKGLFWNCRGLRKEGLAPYVRDLIRVHDFDFMCFQETIVQDLSDTVIRSLDPNRRFLWDWIPSMGRAGGVVSAFKIDRIDVGQRDQGVFILKHIIWDKLLEVKWCLLNVYGPPHKEKRENFLREVAFFCTKISVTYIIGGDFNIIRFSSEKNQNFCLNRFSNIFNVVINACDLREIYIAGGSYTWSNNHTTPTLEKLDIILMSKEWEDLFSFCLSF
jgi:hypothetical protein